MSDMTLMAASSTNDDLAPGDFGDFLLDGRHIPYVERSFNHMNLARFETKITFGDYGKDSDNLLSTWVRSSSSGGALIDEHQEGTTESRFRFSTLHTRSPGQLSLLPLPLPAVEVTGHAVLDGVYPIGDYEGAYYTVIGTTLMKMAASTDDPDDATTVGSVLPNPPVERGTVYKGKLYIALGTGGYVTLTGSTLAAVVIGVKVQSFVLWDNRLFCLTTDGELRYTTDGTTWSATADTLTLPTDREPRKLVWFYDSNGNPTVFIVTDVDLWGWDADANVIHPSRMRIPRHPDNGLAAAEWRDDALYYSAGLGVYRYTASRTVSAVGLDRDDGLPVEYHGRIRDFVPEHNGLIALIEGVAIAQDAAPDTTYTDSGPSSDMTTDGTIARSLNLIAIWNEAGWHTLWASTEPVVQSWMCLSQVAVPNADHTVDYGLHFGYTNGVDQPVDMVIPLPKYFFGPKKLITQDGFPFQASGEHWEGRFDAGMQGFTKLASHLEVNIFDPEDGVAFEGQVEVWYSTDRFPGFRKLGEAAAFGKTVLPFGLTDDGTFSEGEPFGWIELQYRIVRGETVTRAPVVDSIVLKFLKIPLAGSSWTCAIPLTGFEEWKGSTQADIRAHLIDLTTAERFVPLQLTEQGKTYRVRIAQTQGEQPTGVQVAGQMGITILAVPVVGRDDL